jgi:hypothetical protein
VPRRLLVVVTTDVQDATLIVYGLSVHIPRTVLAWRLDPTRAFRKPHVGTLEDPIVVVCDHGYSSSLAAYTLVRRPLCLSRRALSPISTRRICSV